MVNDPEDDSTFSHPRCCLTPFALACLVASLGYPLRDMLRISRRPSSLGTLYVPKAILTSCGDLGEGETGRHGSSSDTIFGVGPKAKKCADSLSLFQS
jgi:hypothetical protein